VGEEGKEKVFGLFVRVGEICAIMEKGQLFSILLVRGILCKQKIPLQ
jgi:hypothetical protein